MDTTRHKHLKRFYKANSLNLTDGLTLCDPQNAAYGFFS